MIAKKHISEVYDVVIDHVGREHLNDLLQDLTTTEAYRRNASFRDTVKLLRQIKHERDQLAIAAIQSQEGTR